MYLYGSALIAACLLTGNAVGALLGDLTGFGTNIGGVGFATLFLIVANMIRPIDQLHPKTMEGIRFWQGMFLPVVVAMTASQDVIHAIDGGAVAFVAGLLPVALGFALIPLLVKCSNKLDRTSQTQENDP